MMFETISAYDSSARPVRMRILRRPDAGLLYYQGPAGVNDENPRPNDIEFQLYHIAENFMTWMRINQAHREDIQRMTIYFSRDEDREAIWDFCGRFFKAQSFLFELIPSEGFSDGTVVEMRAVIRKENSF